MRLLALNTSPVFRIVGIVNVETGKKDSINLQPHSRAQLPPGFDIDPDFQKQHPDIKVHDLDPKSGSIE